MSAIAVQKPDILSDRSLQPVRHDDQSLKGSRARLDGTIEGVEAIFLGIGESLLACLGLLGDMRKAFEAVTEAHAGPEVTSAEAAIDRLVAECLTLLEATRRERALVGDLIRVVSSAGHKIEDLRQTVSMISAIAMNARMIAATIRKHGEMELAVFADDILDSVKRTSVVVDNLTAGQVRLLKLLTAASARSEIFERNFLSATERLQERIGADLAAAVNDRQRAAGASTAAEAACASLSHQVSEVVSSMQVGDYTRQRLEHVSSALASLDQAPEAENLLLTLQCAQMQGARAKLVEESDSLNEAILVLSGDIDRTFGTLKTQLGGNRRAGEPGTARLGLDIAQAANELSRSQCEQEHIMALARSIDDDVAAFGAYDGELHRLEFEMRLVSLNMAIGCSRLGTKGVALGVVSRQMREVVGGMVIQAESVSASLSKLGTLADELGAVRQGSADRGIGALVEDAQQARSILSTADERMEAASSVLDSVGRRIVGLTDDAGGALGKLSGLVEDLSEVEASLGERMESAETGDPALASTHAEMFAALRRAYTMEAERRIHDEVLGTASPAPEEEPAQSADDDLDAFLF
ncbi:hypothetical protein [Jiella mangrovi]|uniref:Methyl-accepting transducer domain-containing protein n=1 Tax=Jiella mangrovi TaxID=2821407 RepID=A0ABS4BH22_9HYPH|nr:hypothetical protein [Jiella mangrovi]MBP0616048.1 hypothetical protein [Jiella mangrovi]